MKNNLKSTIDKNISAVMKLHGSLVSQVNALKDNIPEEDLKEFERISSVSNELLKNKSKFETPEDVQAFLRKNNIY